ncbi:MAG: methyltransferase domain-containing protein [Bacteroidota bacterium]|jgi:2-polyprenyl-3-methyl-5-hydroxy-6-metoxy-1,4-benzoquinol methylase
MKNEKLQQSKIFLEELRERERLRTCGEEAARRYQINHHDRFFKTLEICKKIVPDPRARVLDVGPSYFTTLLAQEYKDVSTLGLDIMTDHGGQRNASAIALALPHVMFELNNSRDIRRWPKVARPFDLIVFAETLEHLYTAPEYSLAFLGSLLTEKGILLVTTPNAAMIMKRLILLLKGKNPYEKIRLIGENPGHYREYTMKELLDIGTLCRLDPVYAEYINFYASANFIYGFLKRLKPAFKDSFVIAFRRM